MEGLSIEEKAKRYDKALEKARQLCAYPTSKPFISDLQDLFPELAEPEDEKIRKSLVAYFAKFKPNDMWDADFSFGDIVAWFEKQGKNNMGISEATMQELENNLNKALEKETPESWNKFLDEQGKQKPTIEMKTPEESLGIDSDTYNKIVDECIYGEQKPADNGEPKFKVEEEKWYVCTQTYVLRGKIVVIKGQIYQAEKDNVIKGEDGCLFIDRHDGKASEYFRYWTIQDAKDGDVLCYKDEISLYRHDIKNCTKQETTFGGFVYYCCYDGKRFVVNSLYSITEQDKMDIHPATKEQRDQLEKAITDAGYEWDAEHRQLRKIESRQEELTEFEKAVKQVMEEAIECGDTHNLKADSDMLLRLVQKSSWSKENEEMVEDIIEAIDTQYAVTDYNEMVSWLKSLKDRYVWKPSDEQMDALNDVISSRDIKYDVLSELWKDLKKLKDEK